MTDAERALWSKLRAGRTGAKWRRQQPIGPYIADFVCHQVRLIVEADGGQHSPEGDQARTALLERAGYRVLRFWNNEILSNLEGVLIRIEEAIAAAPSPTPARQQAAKPAYPLPQGERISTGSSPLEGEDSEACSRSELAQLGEGE
jgi:BirA family transcriptional regulator, biotin operon repressor / biotin---[acetyl-CoA-carboxylase] ligase